MAWAGTITYGSTTVNIWNGTSGIQMKESYLPKVGSDFSETGVVTEDIEFTITGSTKADVEVHMRELNRSFMMARQRQERNAGDRVYVNLTPDGYSAAWRSEILDGLIQPSVITGAWGHFTLIVSGSWVRRNWWEGPQADVPLTNGNGTDNTAGLRVYFCNDGGTVHTTYKRNNYAIIDGVNDISGDLPGYGIFAMTYGPDAAPTTQLFTSIGPSVDMPSWWTETGTGTADATASDGSYQATAVSGTVAREIIYPTSLPSGAPCRLLARIGFSVAGTYRAAARITTLNNTLEYLNPVYLTLGTTMAVYDFGVCQPGIYEYNSGTTTNYIRAEIYVYASSGNLLTDFIELVPVQSVRDYTVDSSSGTDPMIIVDDTVLDKPSAKFGPVDEFYNSISARGSNKILIYPGYEQKLFITGNAWGRDKYVTATLKYRPRRSTL